MPVDSASHVIFRSLGLQPYQAVWEKMKRFTEQRNASSCDEVWLLQHPPVFTLGQAGKTSHLLNSEDVPVIKTDRGGQVTYHGPGQLIAYVLIDLRRRGLGVKTLVNEIEALLINLLSELGINAQRKEKAPGVYVAGKKIASLGLRVRKNCTYHGLSLNVQMDLTPFSGINVCGYEGLEVTQIGDLVAGVNEATVFERLQFHLINRLGYTSHETRKGWS
jgi:lipoyl(octanoyl) transferase